MIPDITYLLLNYNPAGEAVAQDVLGATIDSLFARKSRHLSCEVFLLDQGTTPLHRQWLVEQQCRYNFSTILFTENIGISGAINRIVRLSKSPVVALVTSDVVTTTGMDEDLFAKVQIPEVFQATPFTDKSDLDYQIWQPKEEFGSDHLDLRPLQEKGRSLLNNIFASDQPTYLRCIGSELNVMFWRRSVFDEIGFFDERWKACYENIDFALRCFLAGGCTAVSRDSFVWHHHRMTDKNKAREQVYVQADWQQRIRKAWDDKWPGVSKLIDIYKPLRKKSIRDYPKLSEKFKDNIFLPFEQSHVVL
ncbi:glycosyltransferase family 2 protein [Thiovibrio sp. JS02]